MASSAKIFGKEVRALLGEQFSDGQVQVVPHPSKDLTVYVVLDPKEPPHTGLRYVFALEFCSYPGKPEVSCLTPVWHPNIDPHDLPSMSLQTVDGEQELLFDLCSGNVCLNILDSDYDDRLRLCDFAHALLWLIYNPEYDDCLFGEPSQDDADEEIPENVGDENSSLWTNHFNATYVHHLYNLVPRASEAKEEAVTEDEASATTTVAKVEATAEAEAEAAVAAEAVAAARRDAAKAEAASSLTDHLGVPSSSSTSSSAPDEEASKLRRANFREVLSKSSDGRVNSVRLFLRHSWNRMPPRLRNSLEGVEKELRRSRGEPEEPEAAEEPKAATVE